MPRKKVEVVTEVPLEERVGGYVARKDFEQGYTVTEGKKTVRKVVTGVAGKQFVPPVEWVRDEAFESIVYMKRDRPNGIVFMTPAGSRVTVPIVEA